jgi:runt-related transcription factor
MDIFDRCNGIGLDVNVPVASASNCTTRSANLSTSVVATRIGERTTEVQVSTSSVIGSNTSTGSVTAATAESGSTQLRMQLTGAPAPGNAASPESGVSPLADAYTKMTSDIFAERTLGDYMSEHPGELVRTGNPRFIFFIFRLFLRI